MSSGSHPAGIKCPTCSHIFSSPIALENYSVSKVNLEADSVESLVILLPEHVWKHVKKIILRPAEFELLLKRKPEEDETKGSFIEECGTSGVVLKKEWRKLEGNDKDSYPNFVQYSVSYYQDERPWFETETSTSTIKQLLDEVKAKLVVGSKIELGSYGLLCKREALAINLEYIGSGTFNIELLQASYGYGEVDYVPVCTIGTVQTKATFADGTEIHFE